MTDLLQIPELRELHASGSVVRIPDQLDVPVTRRVRQIIDTPEFHRLSQISQLGLVSHVYPAANHTRFEHSLGVYRMALLYLRKLGTDERFCKTIRAQDAELFILSALLHDLGHWPFCHPIEDIHLPSVPNHELFANSFLLEGELADVLRADWQVLPRDIVALLSEKPRDRRSRILRSMLSGPIDVDKMDYLYRDSLHAGVPYGRNFDQGRLINSLCLNQDGTGIAISTKGRTAAEMMVFARYVMFSEVYWHHTVRAATAMLQRAFYLVHEQIELDTLFRKTESELIQNLRKTAAGGPAGELLDGLFGGSRKLYKHVAEYSFIEHPERHSQLARQPYPWLVACSEELARLLSHRLRRRIAPHEVLFDAPPVQLEVQFSVDVYYPRENSYRDLGDVSPVVRTLAQRQFDDYVKRVRVFAHPSIASEVASYPELTNVVGEAICQMA